MFATADMSSNCWGPNQTLLTSAKHLLQKKKESTSHFLERSLDFMSKDISLEVLCNARVFPQKVLFSLGGSFLYYADRFKLYSAFCASHTKVPKVLAKGNEMRALTRPHGPLKVAQEFPAVYRRCHVMAEGLL